MNGEDNAETYFWFSFVRCDAAQMLFIECKYSISCSYIAAAQLLYSFLVSDMFYLS